MATCFPQSVALLISYFVDRRTRLNDIWSRDSGQTQQFWTEDRLDGKRYGARKPVMILASPRTGSAGEDFTDTMQALKRATVIGSPHGAAPIRSPRIVSAATSMPTSRTAAALARSPTQTGKARASSPIFQRHRPTRSRWPGTCCSDSAMPFNFKGCNVHLLWVSSGRYRTAAVGPQRSPGDFLGDCQARQLTLQRCIDCGTLQMRA